MLRCSTEESKKVGRLDRGKRSRRRLFRRAGKRGGEAGARPKSVEYHQDLGTGFDVEGAG